MEEDSIRYSRQILFPPIGEQGQRRLAQSQVAVIGPRCPRYRAIPPYGTGRSGTDPVNRSGFCGVE